MAEKHLFTPAGPIIHDPAGKTVVPLCTCGQPWDNLSEHYDVLEAMANRARPAEPVEQIPGVEMVPMFDTDGSYIRSVARVDRGTVLMTDERVPRSDWPNAHVPTRKFTLQRMSAGDWQTWVYVEHGTVLSSPHVLGNIFRWLVWGQRKAAWDEGAKTVEEYYLSRDPNRKWPMKDGRLDPDYRVPGLPLNPYR